MSDVRPILRDAPETRRAPIRVARGTGVAACLYLLVLAYGELLPFEFSPAPMRTACLSRAGLGWAGADPADILINIAIFIPVGLLWTLHFARGARGWGGPMLAAQLFGTTLALLYEIAQAWLPLRVSSAADLLNNVLGTCIGAVAAPWLHARAAAWRDAAALRAACLPRRVPWFGADVREVCAALILLIVLCQAPLRLPHSTGAAVPAVVLLSRTSVALNWQLPFVAAFARPNIHALLELLLVFGQFSLLVVAARIALAPRDSRLARLLLTGGAIAWAALLAAAEASAAGGRIDLTAPAAAAAAAPIALAATHAWAHLRRRGLVLLLARQSPRAR